MDMWGGASACPIVALESTRNDVLRPHKDARSLAGREGGERRGCNEGRDAFVADRGG